MRSVPLFFLVVLFFCTFNAQSSDLITESSYKDCDIVSHQKTLGFDELYIYEALEEDNRHEDSVEKGITYAFTSQGDNYLNFCTGSKDYPLLTTIFASEFHLRGPPAISTLL